MKKLYFIYEIVDTEKYLKILEESLFPTWEETLAAEEFFQIDGAVCHKSKKALKWFSDNTISLLEFQVVLTNHALAW